MSGFLKEIKQLSTDELLAEIAWRKKSIGEMVGNLYTSIILSEVGEIQQIIDKRSDRSPAAIAEAMAEEELDKRDERVKNKLKKVISVWQSDIFNLKEEIHQLERSIMNVRTNVLAGHFYNLGSILSSKDIESLCEIHLADLREYLESE